MRNSCRVRFPLARRSRSLLAFALIVGACFVPGSVARVAAQEPAMRWDGLFEVVSGRGDYPYPWSPPTQPADASSRTSRHAISGDGRYVVFESDATNLGTAGSPAVYRRDRRTGLLEMIAPGGRNASISADGHHVAFEVCDPWFRPDFAPICDVWAMDLRDWRRTPLSVAADGTFGDNHSSMPALSANGRFAVFVTTAGNIVGGAGTHQIVFRDRDPDGNGVFDDGVALIETISVDYLSGTSPANADSDSVEVSDDGRFVAFRSLASNLVAGDTNEKWDVFLRDRQAFETRRLNMAFAGQSTYGIDAGQVSMSADGRFVAFASADPMLAPASTDDANNALDVFLYDRQSLSLTRVDVGGAGGNFVPGNGPTSWPTLSADGRYLSLHSSASNVETPPLTPEAQVYVVDRELSRLTRVSIAPEGPAPDAACIQPTISRDGSVVLFWSLATNFLPLEAPPVAAQLYAAVHLAITPSEVVVPGRGGSGTFDVTTQPHTMWWAAWEWGQSWFWATQPPYGVGSGSMTFEAHEPNPNPAQRSMTVRVGTVSARFTQDVGLSVTSVSPNAGPMSGGTTTTIRGTGFEPDLMMHFGGHPASVQFVDTTTLIAVTGPSDRRGLVPVGIATQDGRVAWLDNAFLYLDSTPPEVWGGASGNQQNGWFTSDVYVGWGTWDPESEITSTTCTYFTLTTDTPGTTYTCSATSEGGTGSGSVFVKRDATPPTITVTRPFPAQLFELNSNVTSEFTCADATSGVAECGGGQPSGSPIDTSTSGWRYFGVGATDLAGNGMGTSIDYAVSTGSCTSPPQGLQTWLRFDGDLTDVMSSNGTINAGMPPDSYVEGESGQAYRFVSRGSQSLEHWHDGRLNFSSAMSVAMWLKPGSSTMGTLIKSLYQFRLERTLTGTINWTLFHPNSTTSFGTSTARTPLNAWSHVVFTYNAGEVKVYVNGRLDRTWNVSGATLQGSQGYWNRIRIGGPDEFSGYPYVGAFDELQLFDRALGSGEVENIYLSGASGLCAPIPTFLDVPSPITTTYGAGTYPGVAILRDATGQPLAGKTITLYQGVSDLAGEISPTTTKVTDENGMVRWDAPFDVIAGTYSGFTAYFAGDLQHAHSAWVSATVNVLKATPQIAWATPEPITYGTALSSAQLNATANASGSMSYSPGWGAVPSAGNQTLTAHFSATDYRNYEHVSKSVTLDVLKAQPNVTVTGGTFTYDGQPHAATASAAEYRGLPLTPVTITYDGLPDAPAASGVYTVVATFAGDANHLERSVSTTLTINKATPWVSFSTPTTVTYDGQPHGLIATVHGVGGALGVVQATYNGVAEAPVNVGVYTASASFAGDANHVARTMTTTLRINPATPVVTVSGGSFTYDGQPHDATVTVTGLGGEVLASPVTVTYNNSANRPVAVGSYAVSASAAALGNYGAASGTGTLTITKATPTLSVVAGSFVFDRQAHAATATATGVAGEALGPVTITYNGGPSAPVNAGSYTVTASFAGDSSYEAASATATLTIAKAPSVLSWATPATFTYTNPLSTVQLNAGARTADGAYLGGTFVYTPGAGVVLDPGVHTLSAAFTPFDANFESGTVTTTITVRKWTPGAQVTGDGHHTYDGQPHGITARVIGAGGAELGPITITYNGSAALPVNAGFYQAVIAFAGDDYHEPANIPVFIWIDKATPTLSWNAPGAIVYGTPLGAAQLNAQASVPGTISYSPAAGTVLAATPGRTLNATFVPADSANYNWGSAATTIAVMPAPLTVRANDVAKVYGAPLPAFTAAFAGFVNGDSPASLGGALGFATTATPASPVGAYPLAPSGLSSSNYAITFAAGTLAVVRGAVTVSVSTSPEPSGYEMPMTFTATVAAVQSAPTTPQGTVRFFDGTSLLGTATISGATATLTTAGLDAGTRTIEARYDGDPSFDPGTGSSPHVVKTASATPVIAISSSRNPSSTGQSVTLTANVSMSSGSVTGTIVFYDGATLLGSGTIASGRATLTTSAFAAGSHAITARFLGSATAPPSVSPAFVQAVGATGWKNRTTTMSLTSSGNPALIGDTITFTATVSGSYGAPTGSMLFMVDGVVVGDPAGVSVTTVSSTAARAALSVSGLARGRHKVSAIYLGSSNYKGSAGALTQTVN
jgi:hypothetical protein